MQGILYQDRIMASVTWYGYLRMQGEVFQAIVGANSMPGTAIL